jgi:hypothetical protein
VLSLPQTSKGFTFPKTTQIEMGLELCSLNKNMNNFSIGIRLLLKLAQPAQLDERNSKLSTKSPEICSRRTFLEKRPQWGFHAKTPYTCCTNVPPVQPIRSSNIPIDSTQRAETYWEYQKFADRFSF